MKITIHWFVGDYYYYFILFFSLDLGVEGIDSLLNCKFIHRLVIPPPPLSLAQMKNNYNAVIMKGKGALVSVYILLRVVTFFFERYTIPTVVFHALNRDESLNFYRVATRSHSIDRGFMIGTGIRDEVVTCNVKVRGIGMDRLQ